MTPAGKTFTVWRCALLDGHEGEHNVGEMTLALRRQIRDAYARGGEKAKVVEKVSGHEVPVESLVKRTKAGVISTQSTLGKVAALALDRGCELRGWASSKASGVVGAHHGLRFSVTGSTVIMNGKPVKKERLLERIERIGG